MLVLNEPIPTPYFNVACNQDSSNKCTIVASKAGRSECASNLVSNEGTASAQLSIYAKNKSDVKDVRTEIPTGIFIPQHALPWGGKFTNNILAKWKRRMKE